MPALVRVELVGEAVREWAKKDAAGFYGYIKASPFIAAATAMGLVPNGHHNGHLTDT